MKPKQKLLLAICFFTMLFIIQACRKFDFLSKAKDEFTTEDAKEWYYGTFKKTNAFYGNDHQSLFAGGLKSSSLAKSTNPTYKKYPYWDKGVSYRKGEYEIVEAPLFRELNIIAIPGMEYLSYNEKKQVVEAALQKVVFIKKADNSVAIRVLTIIPTYNYLRSKGYDISENTFSDLDPEFSGLVSIRTWSETSINLLSYTNGKYNKSIKLIKKEETKSSNEFEKSYATSDCGLVPVPIIRRYCIATTGSNGDVPPDDANCTEWEEYDTGEVEFQYVPCENEDGSGDPFLDCLMGNNPDDCTCLVYGLDCGSGGDDTPDDEDCSIAETTQAEIVNSLNSADETVGIVTIASSPAERSQEYKWIFAKGVGINNLKFTSYEDGVHTKSNGEWKWKSFKHKSITRDGTVVGGTLELTLNSSDTHIGTYNAGVKLNYTITGSVVCKGSPIRSDVTKISYKTFHVNDVY